MRADKTKIEKKLIGRRELVSFPELDIEEIEAKVDTGAYTSAIHCSDIHEETMPDGTKVICLDLLDPSHPQYNHKKLRFAEYELREIKSSIGEKQERYVIRTKIRLFDEVIEADFSLSDRSDMKYPVLIGRKLLKGRFIVDVSRKNVAQKFKLKQKQKE
ncbi:ATP-dependent zinc protease family protein [Pontibacter cellulosilyticus]|uniref:ATP-dependent zinc protease n=1 Tax=Pontibacter cellulosilyticus TaxID=1720253 RepID=A0A923NA29_9BACT|nr:RimK/LysX family protein [Pontibacter cellulosilyticus]MBC5993662.1 ATP-dependent zinc protease [Pontibacter cellulosilyticus]